MKEPSLKVIGVYRPAISAETWREQFQVTGDEQATREHFEKLVLIEAVVNEKSLSVSWILLRNLLNQFSPNAIWHCEKHVHYLGIK